MDYIIRNGKNVYIRLNENGRPVTCVEHDRTLFEYSKAKNILKSLPKTLRRLKFEVEPVPDVIVKRAQDTENEEKVIRNDNYTVPDCVLKWIERFGICDDVLKEAEKRREETS